MPQQITGNAGLFYVAWQLSRRGWHVLPTSRNARGADLYISNHDESIVLPVQSKALSRRSDVPLGNSLDALRSPWWVITVGANDPAPRCYILTQAEVKDRAVKNTNSKGQDSHWLPARSFMLDAFADQWHRLGDPA